MKRSYWAIAVVVLAVVAWFYYMSVYQVDDAYIVYRYATNLGHGEGFVFNRGERVEGVTCFLWTVLLAPFAAAGIPLPLVAPILTGLAGVVTLLVVPGTLAVLTGRSRADFRDWTASALLAAHPSFAYWSVGALETVPFALLLLLALRDQAREQVRGHGRRSALWIGLASLTRPETPLLAASFALGRWFDGPGKDSRGKLRDIILWITTVALFLVPFLVFRHFYFGDWLPNTYYAKTGHGFSSNLEAGRLYSLSFLSSLVPGFGAANGLTLGIGVVILIGLVAYGLPRPELRTAALLILGVGTAVLLEGGDWMFLHRMWVPALPPLFLLLAAAGRTLVEAAPRSRPAVLTIAALLATSYVVAGVLQRNGPNGLAVNAAGYRAAHHQVAAFLKEHGQRSDTVALMDVGIIGYESGLRVLDISGLTDRDVAHAPGGFLEKDYPIERLLAEAPRFFVLVNRFKMDEAIKNEPEFQRHYRLVMERNHRYNWTPPESYVLSVYERSDGQDRSCLGGPCYTFRLHPA